MVGVPRLELHRVLVLVGDPVSALVHVGRHVAPVPVPVLLVVDGPGVSAQHRVAPVGVLDGLVVPELEDLVVVEPSLLLGEGHVGGARVGGAVESGLGVISGVAEDV